MMKIKNQLFTYLFMALTMAFAMSCGGNSSQSEGEEHEHAEGMDHDDADSGEMDHEEGGEHEHADGGHEEGGMMGAGFTWLPNEEGMEMMQYKTHNITLATAGDEDVLMFAAGDRASCMFKEMHGNVGLTATIKMEDTAGSVKLLHHSSGRENFEFVSLEGGVMKLGRVENGEEKIFDSKEVDVPSDWFTLTVTAAGTHYKGYLNDKMITHGHGDEMKPGFLGIVASGDGSVSVKKVEATPLEAEH